MVAVGILSIIFWRRRSGSLEKFFFLGGCVGLLWSVRLRRQFRAPIDAS